MERGLGIECHSCFVQVAAMWNDGPFKDAQSDSVKLQSLMDLKYITSPVKSVVGSLKAADAFSQMAKFNLSGLAVVDSEGNLIHNTSATDIKLWLQSECKFDDTIENFLIAIRKMSLDERFPVTMVCTMTFMPTLCYVQIYIVSLITLYAV